MELIKTEHYEGYYVEEVIEYVKTIGKLEDWNHWFIGQTGAIHEGKLVIYKWDFDRFMEGRPDLDLM